MLKATQLTFAAALLAASCGWAMAQDKTEGSEAGPGRPALVQSPQATSSPQSNKMQQKKANLARQKAGTAKNSAGRVRQHIR